MAPPFRGLAASINPGAVQFGTATARITRPTDAHRAGRLPQELTRLRRYGLIVFDEVGRLQ